MVDETQDVVETTEEEQTEVVEATPEEIEGRRNKDATRVRDMDDIGLHQSVNREYAATAAVITGSTVAIVENHDNQVDVAVEQFRKILGK